MQMHFERKKSIISIQTIKYFSTKNVKTVFIYLNKYSNDQSWKLENTKHTNSNYNLYPDYKDTDTH